MKCYYDLHIHSCLSPCGDMDMTPNNIVNMAKIKGLDIIAVTDHNCAQNIDAIVKCGQEIGLTVIPGMEIESAEEIHIVTLFKNTDACHAMEKIIRDAMPNIKNDIEIFGRQAIMNEEDEITGEVDNMLITSCSLSIDEIIKYVRSFDGVCIPAHIDKSSYSIISSFGYIPDELGLNCVEFSKNAEREVFLKSNTYLESYFAIHSSDAHYLRDISEKTNYLECEEVSAEWVVNFLSNFNR